MIPQPFSRTKVHLYHQHYPLDIYNVRAMHRPHTSENSATPLKLSFIPTTLIPCTSSTSTSSKPQISAQIQAQHAAVLHHRHPPRRLVRHARRLRSPRPQETHRGPRAHSELEYGGAISGTYTHTFHTSPFLCIWSKYPIYPSLCHYLPSSYPIPSTLTNIYYQLLIHTLIAYSCVLIDRNLHRRTPKHARNGTLHSRHSHVLGQHLCARAGSCAIQVFGPGYAVGRALFDWRMGGACGEGEAGLECGCCEEVDGTWMGYVGRSKRERSKEGEGCCMIIVSVS